MGKKQKSTDHSLPSTGPILTNNDFVDFVKKHATYEYIEDAKLLPDPWNDLTSNAKVLVVKRFAFDISGLAEPLRLDLPSDMFPNVDKNGVDDTISTTMVLFDRCQFESSMAPSIKLKFTFNVAFTKCFFVKDTALYATERISLIGCRTSPTGKYSLTSRHISVIGDSNDASFKFSGDVTRNFSLILYRLKNVEIENCKGFPFTHLYNCRIVKMTDVSGSGLISENQVGMYDTQFELHRCHFERDISFNSSIVNISVYDSLLNGIRAEHSIINIVSVAAGSTIKLFRAYNCIFTRQLDYSKYDMAFFPIKCNGYTDKDLKGFRLYKKVWMWKGIAALWPTLFEWLIDNVPFGFIDRFRPTKIIAEIHVPDESKRYIGLSSQKVRVSEAYVSDFYAINSDPNIKESLVPIKIPKFATVRSIFDTSFKYRLFKTVKPKKPFSEDTNSCASGIHGFLTPERAINY